MKNDEVERENAQLKKENVQLRKERDFFRLTPNLAQGFKGETLVVELTGGILTGYKDPHDVTVRSGDRLEVKYSHLNAPGKYETKRWNWHGVLGKSNHKKYEYLVLIGEKDARYEDQYPPDLPFVFFLVPRSDVDRIMTGKDIAIITNLDRIKPSNLKSLALTMHLVRTGDTFTKLFLPTDAA